MPGDIRPFKINVPDEAIARLKKKLADATFPEPTDFTEDWKSGAVVSDVKRLAQHWQSGFDWRVQEAKLNEVPQFTTEITVDGFEPIEMHFVHQRSKPGSIPLLFCHGWPGSFIEVLKLLPLLTSSNGDGPTFHVVAPSLPNYGFSGIVKEKGFSLKHYAEAIHKVMLTLGYDKYVTQGGDWGFFITRYVGELYPSHCLATHVNILGASPGLGQMSWAALKWSLGMLSDRDKASVRSTWKQLTTGMGYLLIQGTKPNTLGLGLADSPVGLLGWVYEKLVGWTDSYPWTDDEVLTWISVYQFSKAGPAASVRIYHEWMQMPRGDRNKMMEYVPTVPLGVSHFPKEMTPVVDGWAHNLGPLVYEAIHGRGGHFAAYEEPELLAQDLKNMFSTKGNLPSVVKYFSERRK